MLPEIRKMFDQLVRRIESIERDMTRQAVRLAQTAVNSIVKWVTLDSALTAGGNVTASVIAWDGTTWSDTGKNITVRDWRTSGTSIATGRRCVVLRGFGEWWVVSTQC